MCFPVSKIPRTKNNDAVRVPGYVNVEQAEIIKEIERATRNPLSVGKERNRAK